jgi:hypothetical protein
MSDAFAPPHGPQPPPHPHPTLDFATWGVSSPSIPAVDRIGGGISYDFIPGIALNTSVPDAILLESISTPAT